jgi:hypothetical protein
MKSKKKKRNNRHKRMSKVFTNQWDKLSDPAKMFALRMGQADINIEPVYSDDGKHVVATAVEFDADADPSTLDAAFRYVKGINESIK